ncbi:hypothetical protein AX774_g3637 [Zancudomyces culisetae]|uniref:Uncharacterized protein n=1 Tax=Zancudomyces culisetae TaxID=1213189 RepID=A0A1R1PPJ8_ZANCU|nr:hypothetical protein AX774_g3637 [Zancudomyces culisetae]|eukprot:OMH82879.1 hypothetical protein AX774_g3637 [Zancudomyces culisetae]
MIVNEVIDFRRAAFEQHNAQLQENQEFENQNKQQHYQATHDADKSRAAMTTLEKKYQTKDVGEEESYEDEPSISASYASYDKVNSSKLSSSKDMMEALERDLSGTS